MAGNGYHPNFQRNLEILDTFWRIYENRIIVGHGHYMFLRTEYGKVLILRALILSNGSVTLWQGLNNVSVLKYDPLIETNLKKYYLLSLFWCFTLKTTTSILEKVWTDLEPEIYNENRWKTNILK